MPTAFLLRFQEECLPVNPADARRDTQAATKACPDGMVNDTGSTDLNALPSLMARTATTKTAIRHETSDPDPAHATLSALPRGPVATGTKTFTYVRAETEDEDYGHKSLRTIPWSRPSCRDGTMATTAIKAEATAANLDHCRPVHAILPCS